MPLSIYSPQKKAQHMSGIVGCRRQTRKLTQFKSLKSWRNRDQQPLWKRPAVATPAARSSEIDLGPGELDEVEFGSEAAISKMQMNKIYSRYIIITFGYGY